MKYFLNDDLYESENANGHFWAWVIFQFQSGCKKASKNCDDIICLLTDINWHTIFDFNFLFKNRNKNHYKWGAWIQLWERFMKEVSQHNTNFISNYIGQRRYWWRRVIYIYDWIICYNNYISSWRPISYFIMKSFALFIPENNDTK